MAGRTGEAQRRAALEASCVVCLLIPTALLLADRRIYHHVRPLSSLPSSPSYLGTVCLCHGEDERPAQRSQFSMATIRHKTKINQSERLQNRVPLDRSNLVGVTVGTVAGGSVSIFGNPPGPREERAQQGGPTRSAARPHSAAAKFGRAANPRFKQHHRSRGHAVMHRMHKSAEYTERPSSAVPVCTGSSSLLV